MSRKTGIQRIVSQNDVEWVNRNSVTFRDFHLAFIPRPPTIGGVHASPLICSDLVIRPNQYLEKRPGTFRDAEVVGLNPAVPTTKVLVRGLQSGLRPAPGMPRANELGRYPSFSAASKTRSRVSPKVLC